MVLKEIIIQGAAEHNLKNVGLRLPRNALITITGVSGSGKSSLAFDTIYREGQRRFVESLSTYARQFMGRMDKPRVERIEGLSPTVSIDQKSVNRNPRSTVGTITEIYDHFRLLYARLGVPHCARCGQEVTALGADPIVSRILELPEGTKVQILAPVVRERKGHYRKDIEGWRLKGFVRARIDGSEVRLEDEINLHRYKKHTIELVIDRLRVSAGKRSRISDAVEMALGLTGSLVTLLAGNESRTYSSKLSCPTCDIDIPEMEPSLFSFNSPQGACPDCNGLGFNKSVDAALIVPDPSLSINDGAIRTMTKTGYLCYARLGRESLAKVAAHFGFSLDQSWSSLTRTQQNLLLYGSGDQEVRLSFEWKSGSSSLRVKGEDNKPIAGIIPTMEKAYRFSRPNHLEKFMRVGTCPACNGARLRAAALAVLFNGRRIDELSALAVRDANLFFRGLALEGRAKAIGRDLIAEIRSRIDFLEGVGLDYLTIDRPASSLSGGEAQRVRLATQLGAGLQGVVYVLDEPSIGLHDRDNRRLIGALKDLRDRSNTVVVVEHDRAMMTSSDHLVDMGPGAGRHGGEVVAAGTPEAVAAGRAHELPEGVTARYLRGTETIPLPEKRRSLPKDRLLIRGARQFNLKKINASFPVGLLTVVTGVSGSGKSTLVSKTLVPALRSALRLKNRAEGIAGKGETLTSMVGARHFDRVVEIDQSPIGRTPRSNPATYTKVFGLIRDVFAQSVEARLKGYDKGRFSFNKKGGRCETCGGSGVLEMEMHFLPNVEIPCEDCHGRRYNRETLEILYRGKSVFDVLEMTVAEALDFFGKHRKIVPVLETLRDVGLGYIALGQSSTTLSGGEAQRVKLAAELCRPSTGQTFYVLDEPTTGLHFADIRVLLVTLQRLVDAGNTMVIIEHNLDVIKVADHLIDLGPEGGDEGGRIVAVGTPEEVALVESSLTGASLAPLLGLSKNRRGAEKAKSSAGTRAGRESGHDTRAIRVEGARIHNLKNIDVSIPHNKLTVVTGLSGSGKSSLAIDTIFAEGQRRFVESLSTYARRFVARLDRVPVERIEGLAPAIAIDQRSSARNPRSTVSTSTEIHDYLRVLFARVGQPHCASCRKPIKAYSPGPAAAHALEHMNKRKVMVTAPLYRPGLDRDTALRNPDDLSEIVADLRKKGFVRLWIDGSIVRLDSEEAAAGFDRKAVEEGIDLIVDRLGIKRSSQGRLADSLEEAFREGHGMALVRAAEGGGDLFYSTVPGCIDCGEFVDDISPRFFSFNSHVGACPSCDGLGSLESCDPERLISEPDRPLLGGAMPGKVGSWLSRKGGLDEAVIHALGRLFAFDPSAPWRKIPARARRAVLSGEGVRGNTLTVTMKRRSARKMREYTFDTEWYGLLRRVEEMYRNVNGSGWRGRVIASVLSRTVCPDCGGSRLKPEAMAVTVGEKNIEAIQSLRIEAALRFFDELELEGQARIVAKDALREITNRLRFLCDVGLGHLTLDRPSSTLSGGEAQRIRLASQLGNRLVGVIYVLDEPTVGLHQRDVDRLLDTLIDLKKLGNTVIAVEHDRGTILRADHVIDMGPGAGRSGGRVTAQGTPRKIMKSPESITGRYLSGESVVDEPRAHRPGNGCDLRIEGATRYNLKNIDVAFPLGRFTAVTGVSGSGKSTLVMELLHESLKAMLQSHRGGSTIREGLKSLHGFRKVDKLVVIDQNPIGRSSASNPATYTGAFDPIRDLFASTPEARMRGFAKGRFSFNSGAGRCPACKGRGVEVVEMHFLADVTITCAVCDGKRFDRQTLAVSYRGKTISDVLAMDVAEAAEFFKNHKRISRVLGILERVGLGYIVLGQSSSTLSGGEAQRIKLAAELCKTDTGSTLYLLDEPTTGLHFEDVKSLMGILHMLVDRGNSVIVVEHNLDLISGVDHVIDLGPGGGDAGGRVVAEGTPEQVARNRKSHTGRYLAGYFRELESWKGVCAG